MRKTRSRHQEKEEAVLKFEPMCLLIAANAIITVPIA
jgi:hypothetical protein